MLPLLYFGIFSLFSAKPLYEQWLLTFWNLFFTSLPVLCFGIFEQVWWIWADEVCILYGGEMSCPLVCIRPLGSPETRADESSSSLQVFQPKQRHDLFTVLAMDLERGKQCSTMFRCSLAIPYCEIRNGGRL